MYVEEDGKEKRKKKLKNNSNWLIVTIISIEIKSNIWWNNYFEELNNQPETTQKKEKDVVQISKSTVQELKQVIRKLENNKNPWEIHGISA